MVLESVLISFFYVSLSSFPRINCWKIIFSPLYAFTPFVMDYGLQVHGLPLSSLFSSIGLISVFLLVQCWLGCFRFVLKPEVKGIDKPSFVFLSQDSFGYSRVFCVSILIGWYFPNSVKNVIDNERVIGRKARGPQAEEIDCKCQVLLSLF